MSHAKLKQMKMMLMRGVINNMKRKTLKKKADRLRTRHDIHERSKPSDWEIVKGDIVEVIRGRDEGKQGKVLQVYRRGESVLIDGINLRYHKNTNDTGEIETTMRPSSVLVKNIALVDQDTGIPTPIEWKFSQAAADKERYTRVRQATVSGDIIQKPPEAKTKRKLREPHPTKDTMVRFANQRTWIGPWDLFTQKQKEYIIKDAKEKLPNIANIEAQLPELIYNNVEEVQDYIKMLPYVPHSFFKIGNCEPYQYEPETKKNWSKRRIRRNLRKGEGKRELSNELIDQLSGRRTFARYLTHPIDTNSYWPRVHPDVDPMFERYENAYGGELNPYKENGLRKRDVNFLRDIYGIDEFANVTTQQYAEMREQIDKKNNMEIDEQFNEFVQNDIDNQTQIENINYENDQDVDKQFEEEYDEPIYEYNDEYDEQSNEQSNEQNNQHIEQFENSANIENTENMEDFDYVDDNVNDNVEEVDDDIRDDSDYQDDYENEYEYEEGNIDGNVDEDNVGDDNDNDNRSNNDFFEDVDDSDDERDDRDNNVGKIM